MKRTIQELHAMPKPSNPAELEVLSMWYFGVPLHLSKLNIYPSGFNEEAIGGAQYEVRELYNSYHGKGFNFGSGSIDGYDYSAAFWEYVIGPLTCGGIAGHSYGQTNTYGFRDHKRLQKFSEYLRRNESGRLRKAFERLALLNGEGESMITRDSRAQTSGREDGVVAVSKSLTPA